MLSTQGLLGLIIIIRAVQFKHPCLVLCIPHISIVKITGLYFYKGVGVTKKYKSVCGKSVAQFKNRLSFSIGQDKVYDLLKGPFTPRKGPSRKSCEGPQS